MAVACCLHQKKIEAWDVVFTFYNSLLTLLYTLKCKQLSPVQERYYMFVEVYFYRSNHFYIYSEDLLLTNGMVITRDTY